LAQNAKGHPPVFNKHQIEKSGDYRKDLIGFQMIASQPLGNLIKEQNTQGWPNK